MSKYNTAFSALFRPELWTLIVLVIIFLLSREIWFQFKKGKYNIKMFETIFSLMFGIFFLGAFGMYQMNRVPVYAIYNHKGENPWM